MTAQALVTGGTGFLGQHLVRALRAQGYVVRVLARPQRNPAAARDLRAQGVELLEGDMLDASVLRSALRGVTHVFHLAGQLLVPGFNAASYNRLHIDGTRALLAACADVGSPRVIVHCSTTGVLGPTGPVPADEDEPLRPGNIYERSKAAGELIARATACTQHLPLVVVRPGLVYGPGDRHMLGWFRAIQRGYYRVVGTGRSLQHPIYIDDLIAGVLQCATQPRAVGRVYHLVGERALPIGELAAAIARALGRRLPRVHLPLSLAYAAAVLCEIIPGLPPARRPLTRNRLRFMIQSRAYCGERARQELGFVPRVDLDTGLAHTVAWYRQEGLL